MSDRAYRLLFHTQAPLYGEQMKKIIAAVAVAAALALTGCSASTDSANSSKVVTAESKAAAPDAAPAAPKAEEVPSDYKSALKSAQNYDKILPMSKAGLFAQLTSPAGDKFTAEAAQYAVDNIKADWNANALKSAKNYRDTMAMSPEGIRTQLTSEHGDKYTAEEAAYAVDNLG